jgi:hypothetical protein
VAPLAMDCATKEECDWTKYCIYMALWMHTGLEICIAGDLRVGVCLTCLEEK